MLRREKVELALIVLATLAAWRLASVLPVSVPAGHLILAASVLLLGQGLLRDLWIKFGPKPAAVAEPVPTDAAKPQRIVCMCMESSVGVAGVIAGLCILLCGIGRRIEVSPYCWPALVLVVGITGFIIKDFVLDWKNRTVKRVKDHQSVIPW